MTKQRFISTIFLCAFAVLFAHSIIPHHHDEEAFSHHQASHDDDHEDIDHNFLGQAFSHFQHDQGSTIVFETSSSEYQSSNVNFDKDLFFHVQYIVQVIYKPPTKYPEPYPFYFTSSSFIFNQLLRGPPSLLA